MIATSKSSGVRVTSDGAHPMAGSPPLVLLAAVARIVKTIIGVPDYDRYVAHQREAHPGCAPLSREAFMRERLEARYNRPGSRCC